MKMAETPKARLNRNSEVGTAAGGLLLIGRRGSNVNFPAEGSMGELGLKLVFMVWKPCLCLCLGLLLQ